MAVRGVNCSGVALRDDCTWTPRWQAAGEKKARQAQLSLMTMYPVALHLLWDWRIGPSDSSERAHAREMLDALPAEVLLTTDAGFVGYDFAQAVLAGGRQLLVRVGSNVTLLKQLGYVRESAGIRKNKTSRSDPRKKNEPPASSPHHQTRDPRPNPSRTRNPR